MVSTLQELCYQRLASTMMEAPLGLQEIIMGEVKKRVESRIREELWTTEWMDMRYILADLVPHIMEDIIHTIVTPGVLRSNYMVMFPHLRPSIIRCAVTTAEAAVRKMEERYVHAAFNIANRTTDSEDEEFESPDSEGMYF